MSLEQMKAAAVARLQKAESALSDEDKDEIAAREEIAQIEERATEAERKRRELDLDRRMELARVTLEGSALEGVTIQGFPDTFIVRRDGKAYATWVAAIKSEANGKKIDRAEIDRTLVKSCLYDWNGFTDFDVNPQRTVDLSKYLKENPGLVTPLVDAVAKLVGVFAETRKS